MPQSIRYSPIPTKFTNKVQRQVRDETDGGGRRPMIRPSLDMYGTRVTNFVPKSEPTGKRTVLAYPATRVPAAPSIRSLIGNESSARGLDTQVFHAVSAR